MLAFLRGKIRAIEEGSMIFETENGIWYEIFIHERMFVEFFPFLWTSTQKEVFIYHQISENGQSLFGFLSLEERVFFKELIKISGIGWKAAQLILGLGIEHISQAVAEKRGDIFESVKGIGKKVAAKIVNELQDNKIIVSFGVSHISPVLSTSLWDEYTQMVASLVGMGYPEKRIREMLGELPENLKTTQDILAYLVRNI